MSIHQDDNSETTSNILAPFNPISESAMVVALQLLQLGPDDILFDLGAGDGRLLIQAATCTPGLRCVGIEIDDKFVQRAVQFIEQCAPEVRSRVRMRAGDALVLAEAPALPTDDDTTKHACDELTIHDATALFLFLVPKGLKLVKPLLDRVVSRARAQGRRFRVAAYMFHVPGWEPTCVNRNSKAGAPVYLYEFG